MKRYLSAALVALVAANIVGALPAHAAAHKHKKPKPAACTPYAPGDFAKDAPVVTVTDAATADKPLEQKVTLDRAVADATFGLTDAAAAYFNVQVDSASPNTGLYAHIDFPQRNDYDLEFQYPDQSYAARSHAFNTLNELNDQPLPGLGPISETGHGGQATPTSEELVGIDTADCGGYSVKVANSLGQGGDITVKLWLGEIKNEPEAPGEEPAS
ncbi:MAG: hypothetical protein M3290_04035 [Actinomycetota bacterium]|nr:hypothetical protein [Actinomycetota bacterium]